MSTKHTSRIVVALVAVIALLGSVPAVFAAPDGMPEDEINLIGRLSTDDAGGYVLIEEESGDWVALAGPETLFESHVGATVRITGHWAEDETGERYVEVRAVERVA